MFGSNPIRSAEANVSRIAVQGSFYTLQGEGPYAGRPALFIRLAGCNLACHFCDTEFESGTDYAFEDYCRFLMPTALEHRHLVVITGGEPLRQAAIVPLILFLLMTGTETVQIETAGTLWPEGLSHLCDSYSDRIHIVVSPKTPKLHHEVYKRARDWKYIISAGYEAQGADGLPLRGTQMATRNVLQVLARPPAEMPKEHIWLSPCDAYDPEANAANTKLVAELALRHGYCAGLQMHKIFNVE